MKYSILLFLSILFACSNEDLEQIKDNSINGDWELIEMLMDPGDGSGEFELSNLEITLTIENNERISANGILCGFVESNDLIIGNISINDSIVTVNCQTGELDFKMNLDNSNLILSNLSCREACRAKFKRI